jgi:hypothetical protein
MLERAMLPPPSTLKIEAAQPYETQVPMYHIFASYPESQHKYEYPEPQKNCHKSDKQESYFLVSVGILLFKNIYAE